MVVQIDWHLFLSWSFCWIFCCERTFTFAIVCRKWAKKTTALPLLRGKYTLNRLYIFCFCFFFKPLIVSLVQQNHHVYCYCYFLIHTVCTSFRIVLYCLIYSLFLLAVIAMNDWLRNKLHMCHIWETWPGANTYTVMRVMTITIKVQVLMENSDE